MAILNVQVETVGQSGQVPRVIYIESTNSVSEVVATGFLDGIVQDGIPLFTTDIAEVSTRATPSSKPTSNLYNITYANGHWTLVAIGGGSGGDAWLLGGNTAIGPQIFGTLTDYPISFRANDFEYMEFNTADSSLNISADNLQVAASSLASIEGDSVTLEAFTEIGIGNVSTPSIIIGNKDISTNSLEIDSQVLKLNNVNSAAAQTDVLFYNTSTKVVTAGIAPTSFDPASDQTITGDWAFTGDFSVNLTGHNVNIDTTTNVNISSDGDINLTPDNDLVLSAGDDANINAVTSIGLGNSSTPIVVIGNNTSPTNSTSINSQVVKLNNLNSSSQANALFYNSTTKVVTYATAPTAFDPTSNQTISGAWSFTGQFGVNLTAHDITLVTTTDMSATAANVTFTSSTFKVVTLPSATTSNVVYYNSGSGAFSYGSAPTNPTGIPHWSSSTTYSIGDLATDSIGVIYASTANSNLNNALTDQTKWLPNLQYGMTTPNNLPYSLTVPANYTLTWPLLNIPTATTFTVASSANYIGVSTVIISGTGIMRVDGTAIIIY